MRWAVAYAFERLLVPVVVALLFMSVFGDASGGANPFVEQINRWLGFNELMRALGARF
jgi:hypothetical protein